MDDGQLQVDARLLHDGTESFDLLLAVAGALEVHAGGEVAAHDLQTRGIAAGIVVHNGVSGHVDAHIGGALIGAFAHDALHHGFEHGECFDVAVVVDGGLAVRLQMERVDDVRVVEVGGGGLVRDVHGMVQRKIPDGERLVFGVAGVDAALVLVVELRQARGEFAGAGAGRGDYDERSGGLDVVVLAVSVV